MTDNFLKYGEKEASTYDNDREIEPIWHVENDFVKSFFEDRQVERLLDVPVGTGRFINYYVCVNEIAGVDLSPHMLAQAKCKATSAQVSIKLHQGQLADLNFPDGFFDAAVCWRLIHLLDAEECKELLKEVVRVCDGDILLQLYFPLEGLARLSWRWKRLLQALRAILRPTRKAKASPWAHIKTFRHTKSCLNDYITSTGLTVKRKELLGVTDGQEVWCYVLSRL